MGLFSRKSKDIEILAPCDGTLIALDKVSDEAFAQKMLGDGIAIQPTGKTFVAPMTGVLATVFPTGHAYGIRHKSGVELLLHIGMDSVSLNGEGFSVKVKQDDKVTNGDELCEVDLDLLRDKIPSLDTPIVFTPNTMEGYQINILKEGQVTKGELVAIIKKS